MNRISLTLGIAAIAAISAPLSAQGRGRNAQGIPPGHMPPAGMCRIWLDGVAPGRQPRPTDCATAQARVPLNGRVIYGNDRINGNRNGGKYGRNSGVYDRNGDGVIDSRERGGTTDCRWYDVNCRTTSSNSSGGWHQVGRDRNGNVIYERRVADRNGNAVIQTARRNSNGRFVIVDSRRVSNRRNDGRFDARIDRRGDDDDDDDGDDDDEDDDDDDDRYESRQRNQGRRH